MEIPKKIIELYETYKKIIASTNQPDMKIIFTESASYKEGPVLEMSLHKDNTIIQSLELNFSNEERKLYEYIGLSCMYLLLKKRFESPEEEEEIELIFQIEDSIVYEESKKIMSLWHQKKQEEIKHILEQRYWHLVKTDETSIKDTISLINYQTSTLSKRYKHAVKGNTSTHE